MRGSRRGSLTRVHADATVVVATHDVEPFVGLARRAIVVAGGVPRVLDPLPQQIDERTVLLDRSARGE